MSLQKFVPALAIELRRSRYLIGFIFFSHVGALLVQFWLPVPGWFRFVLILMLCWSCYQAWISHVGYIHTIRWDSNGQWWLINGLFP